MALCDATAYKGSLCVPAPHVDEPASPSLTDKIPCIANTVNTACDEAAGQPSVLGSCSEEIEALHRVHAVDGILGHPKDGLAAQTRGTTSLPGTSPALYGLLRCWAGLIHY